MRGGIFEGKASDRVEQIASLVIGAAIEVHRALGPGYTENIYQAALEAELEYQRIPFRRQVAFELVYRDRLIGEGRLDLLVDDCLIIELKAVEALGSIHTAQAITYLKATGHELALLLNFNVAVMRAGIKRVLLTSS
jgi:GxxExxY protein